MRGQDYAPEPLIMVNTNFGQVMQINHWAADNHRLSYTSYNMNSSSGQTDCPRFTERRDKAENWNNDAEAVTSYSVATDNSWTKVTAPEGAVYKETFETTGCRKGLTSNTKNYLNATDAAADTDAAPTWKKRTTILWMQSDESLTYQKNPRVTETNVYDSDGNRKRIVIDYGSYAVYSLPTSLSSLPLMARRCCAAPTPITISALPTQIGASLVW